MPMLISDKEEFVFIHNPKAAGTSIRTFFMPHEDRNDYYWGHLYSTVKSRVIDKAHLAMKDFISCFDDAELLDKYFVFGFVRNPYDKVYSAYMTHRKIKNETLGFNDFIKQKIDDCSVRYDWGMVHFCPQHYFFYDDNKIKADFIGRVENIERDFIHACKMINLCIDRPLQFLNAGEYANAVETRNINWPKYILEYTQQSLDVVNQVYDRDFVFFGYDKIHKMGDINEFFEVCHDRVIENELHYIKGSDQYYKTLISQIIPEIKNEKNFTEALLGVDMKISEYKNENNKLHKRNELLVSELKEVNSEIEKKNNALFLLQEELKKIKSSNSWAVTRSLRICRKLMGF